MPNAKHSTLLTVAVSEDAMGSVVSRLREMDGVTDVQLLFETDLTPIEEPEALEERPQQQRRTRSGDGARSVATALHVTGQTPIEILRTAYAKQGYSVAGLSGLLHRMQMRKQIKRLSTGMYELTDKGSRELLVPINMNESKKALDKVAARLKKTNRPKTRPTAGQYKLTSAVKPPPQGRYQGKRVNNASGVRGIVLRTLSDAPMDSNSLQQVLTQHSLSPTNMTGTVAKMAREGLISTDGRGHYSLTTEGEKVVSMNDTTSTNELRG